MISSLLLFLLLQLRNDPGAVPPKISASSTGYVRARTVVCRDASFTGGVNAPPILCWDMVTAASSRKVPARPAAYGCIESAACGPAVPARLEYFCADKRRVLLEQEDGVHICVLFPEIKAQEEEKK